MSSDGSSRELLTFPLAPSVRTKLTSAGFLTQADLGNIKPSELSKEAGISMEEALEVLKIVRREERVVGSCSVSALELLEQEQNLPGIVTFCAQLDEALGGGVALRKVTEICGAPGVGKTQMCIQLAVDASIPEELGGAGGEAVYIDTEGSFIIERVVDVAQATVEHCHRMAATVSGNPEMNYNLETILSGIHYFRCHDYIELLAIIHILTNFLQQHPKVKVVVVDSIAFPFRHSFDDMSQRTRLLAGMAQSCIKLAIDFSLAVVLTNQMTTRFSTESGITEIIPALGESWGHACTVRLVLFWEAGQRHAMLYKSPSKQETTVVFQVTAGGIRDVVHKPSKFNCVASGEPHLEEEFAPKKKPKTS